jgi:hypothetical protein
MIENKYQELHTRLEGLTCMYNDFQNKLKTRVTELIDQFHLSPEQREELDFGIIIPYDRTLQKYADKINSDSTLNELADKISGTILSGCTEIISHLYSKGYKVPGYNLPDFIEFPEENIYEIINLMRGLGGYEHIHCIGDKIALEIPARIVVENDKHFLFYIDSWLATIKEIGFED